MEQFPLHHLQQTKQLFQLVGFRSPSMDDVATHLSISKKTLYKYVANKHELVELITQLHLNEFTENVTQIEEQQLSPRDLLIALSSWLELVYRTIHKKSLTDLQRYYYSSYNLFETFERTVCYNAFLPIFEQQLTNDLTEKQIQASVLLFMNGIKAITHKTIQPSLSIQQTKTIQQTIVLMQLKAFGI